ncbi:MAG: Uma2 family endonuclease, partial [Spirulinaceae cyanobacterium RM2_2_10]|nr:Uma2 family endonuclease [Spirulinaceae cyanobacterium RM2_2_10]
PSLQDYILISQDDHRIEHYMRRENDIWQLYEAAGIHAQVVIQSIDCVLTLEDVYEKVELEVEDSGITRDTTKEGQNVSNT